MYFINKYNPSKQDLISRYTSFSRVVELLSTSELGFVKPALWDDPFEDFFNKVEKFDKFGHEILDFNKENVYGMCFTELDESDFAWRVYGDNGNGCQILFNPLELSKSLQERDENISEFSIGRIQYLTQTEISSQLESDGVLDFSSFTWAVAFRTDLFLKREAFSHEKEVRILCKPHNTSLLENDIIYKKIDTSIIREIKFGPRINNRLFETLKNRLNSLGFKGEISKSNLYEFPIKKIIVDILPLPD